MIARNLLAEAITDASDDLHDVDAILDGLAKLLVPGDNPDRLLCIAIERLWKAIRRLDGADALSAGAP